MVFKKPYWIAVALMALPAGAMAQSPGFYIGGAAGANWSNDSDVTGAGVPNGTSVDYDTGWAGLLNGGYAFTNGIRTELEVGYRGNDVDGVNGVQAAAGDVSSWDLMGNVYYDFRNSSKFTPYVGAGIGGAWVDFDGISTPVAGRTLSGDDIGFAYQGIAGVSYAITDALGLFADYRYMATTDLSVDSNNNNQSADMEYSNHSLFLGMRYSFGAPAPKPIAEAPPPPPPPAPPPPAPVAPQNYLVFFDFNKATLTPDSAQVIAAAAADFKRAGAARIEATGHADRVGSDRYNVALSQRRSEVVKQELIRNGIPAQDIVVYAKGEADPLVATPDGVKEPQNRRVEIVIGR